ncbi:hypothetical protein RGQ21_67340 [Kitasatospora aureofaciens]|nr:hypothetical protein RGQ21_67340 [Kitasatospora aureofaciens]
MSQTRERRMFLYWKSLKRNREYQFGMRKGWYHKPLMMVAVKFRLPIREVRDIIEAQKDES